MLILQDTEKMQTAKLWRKEKLVLVLGAIIKKIQDIKIIIIFLGAKEDLTSMEMEIIEIIEVEAGEEEEAGEMEEEEVVEEAEEPPNQMLKV